MRRTRLSCLLAIISCAPLPALAQELSLDSLLRANSYDLEVRDGSLTGPGRTFLLEAASRAQFVAIAEEHNVRELNELTGKLFELLHAEYGFNHLALEQGGIITSWMGSHARRGDFAAIARLAARYPQAPTFATDEELRLIADVGRVSSSTAQPVWGIDQEFGVLHILERLAELAPGETDRAALDSLILAAKPHEADRFASNVHYVAEVAAPRDFESLPALFRAASDGEADTLIEALQRTVRIYHNFTLSRQGLPTAYENGREREESMKLRFMERYREAQHAGEPLPRVLAKLGHWHIYRGIYRANVPTFGNFLSEFSIANGMGTFILSTYVVDSAEAWRNSSSPVARAAGAGTYTVVDLRALRPFAHQNMIRDLTDGLKQVLFQADAALIIRGGQTGSYDIVRQRR